MSEPVVTIFRSRLRPEARDEYVAWAERMDRLATQMPGFVGIKTFQATDGERVSIVEFASDAESLAWSRHPEHLEAQRLGRERFYADFEVIVCKPLRRYKLHR
jgi:heme-degrading monooxygenase HmoA